MKISKIRAHVRDFERGVPAELIQGSQANGEHFGVGLSRMRSVSKI